MVRLAIHPNPPFVSGRCGLCGNETAPAAGPRLYLADQEAVVCHACGRKHAPSLAALLDLAGVAKRVGKVGRHTLVPPLTALLDLARAAENYSFSITGGGKQAA